MPAQIAAILAHELVHAAVGIAAGHGKAFKQVVVGLGLIGPMRFTTPCNAFLLPHADPRSSKQAPFPHVRLDTGGETTAPKNQAAQMLKCEGAACDYTVRTWRKWLETAGARPCPIEGHGPMRHDQIGDDDDEAVNDG